MEDTSYRWGYTFLRGDSRLSFEERFYLIDQATQMYLDNEYERSIKFDSLEGRISTKGNYANLGCFSGQKFWAEVENGRGKIKVSFIVNERTGINNVQREREFIN